MWLSLPSDRARQSTREGDPVLFAEMADAWMKVRPAPPYFWLGADGDKEAA
jgi:hypothetical protein